jgi:hypothetical protein
MAQVYEPCDLIERALKSLSLDDNLPKFNENEINDASIIQALADKDGTAALPGILGGCMPSGRVPRSLQHSRQRWSTARKTKRASGNRSSVVLPPRKQLLQRSSRAKQTWSVQQAKVWWT